MINNYTRLIDNLQYLKLYEISEKLNSFDFKNNKDFIDQLLELTIVKLMLNLSEPKGL